MGKIDRLRKTQAEKHTALHTLHQEILNNCIDPQRINKLLFELQLATVQRHMIDQAIVAEQERRSLPLIQRIFRKA